MEDKIMLPIIRSRTLFPNLADEFFGKDWLPNIFDNKPNVTVPAVNIIEGKEDYRIEVAAPGLEKKDFKLNVEDDMLTISSEKEYNKEEKDEKIMRREFSYSYFKRSFILPEGTDTDKINASHKDGVLSIVIPKKEEAKVKPARLIDIS